jgi:hypothetical protein
LLFNAEERVVSGRMLGVRCTAEGCAAGRELAWVAVRGGTDEPERALGAEAFGCCAEG